MYLEFKYLYTNECEVCLCVCKCVSVICVCNKEEQKKTSNVRRVCDLMPFSPSSYDEDRGVLWNRAIFALNCKLWTTMIRGGGV